MTGSVKDRVALHIIRTAYADGLLKPGDTIVEASSGNTGISFAAIGRALGHDVRVYMPNWMSSERVQMIHPDEFGWIRRLCKSSEMAIDTWNLVVAIVCHVENRCSAQRL